MAIQLPSGFKIGSKEPIDSRLVLTKAQMKAANDRVMPSVYFAICKEDGKQYLYNKENDIDEELGKFRLATTDNFPFVSLTKHDEYLYEVQYDNLDYNYAYEYFKENDLSIDTGACSAIRKGDFVLRSYDWNYNKGITFKVKTPATNARYASIGTAYIDSITKDIVESAEYTKDYKILPFLMKDGINEHRLFIEENVVPNQKGDTEQDPTGKQEICNLMLIRYILDKCKTAEEAVECIENELAIYNHPSRTAMGFEIHFLIADPTETYIVEFKNNNTVIHKVGEEENYPSYMTNFFITDLELNEDGSVYTPESQDSTHTAMTTNKITSHGAGLERWNIINNSYEDLSDRISFRQLGNDLFYTNSYKDSTVPYWYSELTDDYGTTDITVDTPVSGFANIKAATQAVFANRSRDPESEYFGTWHSMHSDIYDLKNKKIYCVVQEGVVEHEFELKYFTKQEVLEMIEYGTEEFVTHDEPIEVEAHLEEIDADSLNGHKSEDFILKSKLTHRFVSALWEDDFREEIDITTWED